MLLCCWVSATTLMVATLFEGHADRTLLQHQYTRLVVRILANWAGTTSSLELEQTRQLTV